MKVDGNKPKQHLKFIDNGYETYDQEPLRLQYAAKIMAGFAAEPEPHRSISGMAKLALEWADALIAEHNKQ